MHHHSVAHASIIVAAHTSQGAHRAHGTHRAHTRPHALGPGGRGHDHGGDHLFVEGGLGGGRRTHQRVDDLVRGLHDGGQVRGLRAGGSGVGGRFEDLKEGG